MVKETVININNIRSIDNQDTLCDELINCNLSLENKIRVEIFYQQHKTKMFASIFAVIIGLAILIAVQNNGNTEVNYCNGYTPDTLATEVSVKCLQQLWAKNGCVIKSGSIPDSYSGFWLKSPEGGKLIMCGSSLKQTPYCGIGSFQNICSWIYQCKIDGF